MNQTQSPAFLHRLVSVPRRLFAKAPPRKFQTPNHVTKMGEPAFVAKRHPRLSPGFEAKPKTPTQAPRHATLGALAVKRTWPQPERENLFREDFEI